MIQCRLASLGRTTLTRNLRFLIAYWNKKQFIEIKTFLLLFLVFQDHFLYCWFILQLCIQLTMWLKLFKNWSSFQWHTQRIFLAQEQQNHFRKYKSWINKIFQTSRMVNQWNFDESAFIWFFIFLKYFKFSTKRSRSWKFCEARNKFS